MNELAKLVDDFIESRGVKKTWIMEKLQVTSQYYYKLMRKKNFTVEDANRILAPLDYKIKVSYEIEKVQ